LYKYINAIANYTLKSIGKHFMTNATRRASCGQARRRAAPLALRPCGDRAAFRGFAQSIGAKDAPADIDGSPYAKASGDEAAAHRTKDMQKSICRMKPGRRKGDPNFFAPRR
jgi:hypothetical protein